MDGGVGISCGVSSDAGVHSCRAAGGVDGGAGGGAGERKELKISFSFSHYCLVKPVAM